MRPATGTPGEPAWGRQTGEPIPGHRPDFADARDSDLYTDTAYAPRTSPPDPPSQPPRGDGRGSEPHVQGPMLNPPVWTWEVPAYFWLGGIAAGSSWIAAASGDARARWITLAAAVPCAPLLIADLGRPARFLNMLRIFKPRSPMSMGAWCLAAFSNAAALAAVRDSRAASAATAGLGLYLGSYTGVLLASTAVPVWSRSRTLLPPLFVSSALAGAAAANRLAGLPTEPLQTAALGAELAISAVNDRRLGELRPHNRLLTAAKIAGAAALLTRRSRISSALALGSGLALRFGWLQAGRESARDDEAVARAARQASQSRGSSP